MNEYGYIYITENLINGKRYIGKHSKSFFDESYKGSGKLLWRAINKHGWDNFKTEILEWCSNKDELNEREMYWISYYDAVSSDNFYNISKGGDGGIGGATWFPKGSMNPMYNKHHTLEARDKISKRVNEYYKSDDAHKNMSDIMKAYYTEHPVINRKPHSDETKEKIRQKRIEYYQDHPEAREEQSIRMNEYYKTHDGYNLGRKMSEITKQEMSKTKERYYQDHPEAREKHSEFMKEYYRTHGNPMKGRHHTEESKKLISEAKKGSHISEDTKNKIRDKTGTRICCIDTGEIFLSIRQLSEKIGVGRSTCMRCLKEGKVMPNGYMYEVVKSA